MQYNTICKRQYEHMNHIYVGKGVNRSEIPIYGSPLTGSYY